MLRKHVTVYTETMAINRGSDAKLASRHTYGSFVERYPDYPQWLDGNVWELDIATEILEPLESFRSSMHYQARVFGMKLASRQEWRDNNTRRVLLIQAQ